MSSPEMASRKDVTSRSRARVTQELGRARFTLPGSDGKSCFELTTHFTGRASLRHFLSGLRKIENHYRDAELVQVIQVEVNTWSHAEVVCCLRNHLARITDQELKLTLRARDRDGQKHIIEVTIEVMYEDGRGSSSLGDKVRAAYDIIVRTTDKIISTPDVTDVQFESSYYIRIRHGAQTGYFLKEGSDHTMDMDIPTTDTGDYVFKCYKFIGHNLERNEGEGGDFPTLCVLQQPRSGQFVAACASSGCLRTDEDGGFRTDIESITTPDCHFFIVHRTGNSGTDSFCLRPLVMRNYYLRYDAVKGLKLTKCRTPPYKDFARVRYFSFEFVPAQSPAD